RQSRIVVIQGKLGLNGGQPERLHLCVQGKALVQISHQGFCSSSVACHSERKSRFKFDPLARRHKLQSLGRNCPSLRGDTVGGFPLRRNRLPYCTRFFTVRSYARVNRPSRQVPRLAEVTPVSLGVGCESQPEILVFELAGEPLLLFPHRLRISTEKCERIERRREYVIVRLAGLHLADDVARLLETVQGEK